MKEKDGIVTVYSIKKVPLTLTSKVLHETNNIYLFVRCRARYSHLPTIFFSYLPNAFQVSHALMYLSIVKSGIFVQHRARSIFDQDFICPL